MPEMNELYATDEVLDQVKLAFEKSEPFENIKLGEFFENPYELSDRLNVVDFQREKDPLHHDFESADLPTSLVAKLQVSLVSLLKKFSLTTLTQAKVYRLGHKSYSMLTDVDKTTNKTTYDVIIDFSDGWDPGFGGDIVYANGEGETLEIEPSDNTIILVKKEPETKFFFKYCNHYSKDYERVFVILTFKVD